MLPCKRLLVRQHFRKSLILAINALPFSTEAGSLQTHYASRIEDVARMFERLSGLRIDSPQRKRLLEAKKRFDNLVPPSCNSSSSFKDLTSVLENVEIEVQDTLAETEILRDLLEVRQSSVSGGGRGVFARFVVSSLFIQINAPPIS